MILDVMARDGECLAFVQPSSAQAAQRLYVHFSAELQPQMIRDAQGEVAGILLRCGGGGVTQLVTKVEAALGLPLEHRQPEPQRQGADLMRLRGALGLAGQGMIIAAGLRSQNTKKHLAAGISMAANAMNMGYGGQKKEDDVRLGIANARIDDAVTAVTGTAVAHTDAPLRDADFNRFMQANVTRISDGMRMGGKLLFALAGVEGGNRSDLRHGQLSLLAKLISVTGKDEDPYQEDKDVLTRLRERSNTISGVMEFIGSVPLYTAGLEMQKPNAKMLALGAEAGDIRMAGKLQMAGALLVLSGLVAKSMAPFTSQTINRDKLYEHAARALQDVPEHQRADVLAQLTSLAAEVLDEEVAKRRLPASSVAGFGEIYLNVLARMPQQALPLPQVSQIEHEGRQHEAATGKSAA
jgi:hypothetical protein